MLYATVRQRKIHVKNPVTVIQNGVNVDELTLEMDDEWAAMDGIVAVFTLKYSEKEESTEGDTTTTTIVSKEIAKEMLHTFGKPVMVPWECLEHTGRLMVSITGFVDGEKVMTTMYPDSFWNVVQNGPKEGSEPMEPTPTLYEQVLAAAGSANSAATAATEARAELLQDKEAGAFDGEDGQTPEFEIGTVTTGAAGSEAQVNMTGTQLKPILNFVLPRGASGKDGTPGRDGSPGRDGTDGKDGSPGQPGRDGSDGQDGKDGVDGKDGRGILEIVDNGNGTWTIRYTDGTTQTVKPPAPIDGGYYIPKVENGVLSWTPSKTDMPSVGSENINGADGKDGTSVTVSSVSESTTDGGTNTVTFSDGKKLNVKNGSAGSNGVDGVSPILSVKAISGGHRITITDAAGFKTVDVLDGQDGAPGDAGKDGSDGADGRGIQKIERTSGTGTAGSSDTYTITYTDNTTSRFTVYNGADGTSFVVKDRYATLAALKAAHATGSEGEAYAVGAESENIIYIWGVDTGDWTPIGSLQGPQGVAGEDGRAAEFRASGGYLQWRLVGDTSWTNLLPLSDITGPAGSDGAAGTAGKDGVSPTVSVQKITGGNRLTITDAAGTKTMDIMDGVTGQTGAPGDPGTAGQNGVSPTVSISTIEGGHRVSVTDAGGTKTFDVMDGADGKDGQDGYTPQRGVDYFDGQDGTSVTVSSVSESTTDGGTNVVTFSDGNKLNVKNGSKGSDGAAGDTGPAGRGVKKMEYNSAANNWTVTYTDNTTETVDGPTLFSGNYTDLSGIPSTFAPSAHTQAASTITAGTFAGQVVANASGQAPGTYLLRNSKVSASEENPTVNGQICWVRG